MPLASSLCFRVLTSVFLVTLQIVSPSSLSFGLPMCSVLSVLPASKIFFRVFVFSILIFFLGNAVDTQEADVVLLRCTVITFHSMLILLISL